MFIPLKVLRSSNGRTTGSGPVYWGSSPYLRTLGGSPRIGGSPRHSTGRHVEQYGESLISNIKIRVLKNEPLCLF